MAVANSKKHKKKVWFESFADFNKPIKNSVRPGFKVSLPVSRQQNLEMYQNHLKQAGIDTGGYTPILGKLSPRRHR